MSYGNASLHTAEHCCPECGGAYAQVDRHGVRFLGPATVAYDGHVIELTVMQADLFRMLARRFGNLVHQESMYALWHGRDVEEISIKVLVHKLRKKLEGSGLAIETVRSCGYKLVSNVEGKA